jgi:RNA polymerase sigma-70 factor (ECF subfamily)
LSICPGKSRAFLRTTNSVQGLTPNWSRGILKELKSALFYEKILLMNEKEFIKFYDDNAKAIYRYIFLRVNSKEAAQDLSSEAFLKAWNRISNIGSLDIKNPRAFLYQVARNLVIDFYRKKSRNELSLDEMELDIPDLESNFEEKTNLGLELEPIRAALEKIKDDYAEVVIWHYLDELSVPEIAEVLDKSEGAVRVMLSRGLEQVRKQMNKS